MRRVAVLFGCVVVGGALLVPASALASDDDRVARWIAVEDQFAAVLPDGTTYDEENPPPEEETALPVGAQFFIGEVLYATEDGTTRGDAVGRTYIECTADIAPETFRCDATFVFTGGAQLHATVLLDFTTLDPAAPEAFDVAVIGGTGEYSDVDGVVSVLDTSDADDPAGETTTLYEAHLE
jgi:hypothetical protein